MTSDTYASIDEVGGQIRERMISPVALTDACLARIAELNPRLNAFITVIADSACEQARQAASEIEERRSRGPLHGIPVAVKDFYDTQGVKTTAAFERFANRVPTKDADVVARLKQAGAVVIGKTNMDTLGMATTGQESFYGPVKNPWNTDYITGGSSSGSAVAVATGMCCATVDTDAIGSRRLPASCCGVVGFKGTYGLISPAGILGGEAPPDEVIAWFSHPAVTARRVIDAAIVVDMLKNDVVSSAERPETSACRGGVEPQHERGRRRRLRQGGGHRRGPRTSRQPDRDSFCKGEHRHRSHRTRPTNHFSGAVRRYRRCAAADDDRHRCRAQPKRGIPRLCRPRIRLSQTTSACRR